MAQVAGIKEEEDMLIRFKRIDKLQYYLQYLSIINGIVFKRLHPRALRFYGFILYEWSRVPGSSRKLTEKGIKVLAKKYGYEVRIVYKFIKELKEKGVIGKGMELLDRNIIIDKELVFKWEIEDGNNIENKQDSDVSARAEQR
jgi:hypothetical protein